MDNDPSQRTGMMMKSILAIFLTLLLCTQVLAQEDEEKPVGPPTEQEQAEQEKAELQQPELEVDPNDPNAAFLKKAYEITDFLHNTRLTYEQMDKHYLTPYSYTVSEEVRKNNTKEAIFVSVVFQMIRDAANRGLERKRDLELQQLTPAEDAAPEKEKAEKAEQ